jgi:hypothetical protein
MPKRDPNQTPKAGRPAEQHDNDENLSTTGKDEDFGPSPYDRATPDMPEKRVITKGERERPGPAADELTGGEDVGQSDALMQTSEPERHGRPQDVHNPYASEEQLANVGGGGLHERINNEQPLPDQGESSLHQRINNETDGEVGGEDDEDLALGE